MFDPAIIQDLQKAMAPPPIVPPAIERAWLSPMAERGERRVGAFVDAAEKEGEQWRANLTVWAETFNRYRDLPRNEADLEVLDIVLHKTARQAIDLHREADRDLKRRDRFRKRVAEVDPSAAKVLWTQVQRMHRLQVDNAIAVERLATAILEHRNAADTRVGAKPGTPDKPLRPNKTTIAAMTSARAGGLEKVKLDDLRAALLEDD